MKRIFTPLIAFVITIMLPFSAAWSHGDTSPRHGGVVAVDGETLFELVVHQDSVDLYVMYDAEDIESAEYKATLILKSDEQKEKLKLAPAGGNKFEIKGATIPEGKQVTVFLKNTETRASASAVFMIN